MVPAKGFIVFAVVLSLWLELTQTQGYTSVSPIWLTSSYMRAGSQDVIATLTGSAVDPTYVFTFSSPLPGVPNLAYGIRRYRGADTIREEIFEIRKLSLDAKSFKVQVDIVGSTNIYTLNVPYLAVDPTFPHHLNSFDNVPINYGGTLTNITSKSMSTTYYSNTINYTQQALGRAYTNFSSPLESNKILLYITSLSIVATGWDIIWGYYPVNMNVSSKIVSSNTYSLSVSLSIYVAIAKLQFSMIIFNADDVESSKKYVIVYDVWETDDQGGFIEVPSAFVDNFILGLTDFSTMDGKCVITYQWSFANVSGKYGIQLAVSQPSNANYDCALSRMKSTVFYMKTWQCPQTNPYFNLTTNLCQNGCGIYFFPNSSVYQCQDCEWACAICMSSTFCTGCDSTSDFRTLVNVSGKASCVCMPGYYQDPVDPTNKKCLPCIANCLTCNSSTVCQVCDGVGGYILTTDKKCKKCGYGCLSCNEVPYTCFQCAPGMVFDSVQQKCVCLAGTYASNSSVTCLACSPTCAACTGPTSSECTNCSTNSTLPFYNSTTRQCQSTCGEYFFEDWAIFNCSSCPVGCNRCTSGGNCTTCDLNTNKRNLTIVNGVSSCPCIQGYYQDTNNTRNNVCLQCNISNCLACNSSTTCTLCNDLTGYVLNTTNQCKYCGYGCLACNSTPYVCLQCKTGMVYDSAQQKCVCLAGTYASNVTVGCLPCHATCGSCTGPSSSECTNCTRNSSTPFFNSTTRQCQSTCGEYFFEDWAIFNCSSCPVGCNRCSSASNCTTCDLTTNKRSLAISASGVSSCPCIQGYYQDANNSLSNVCLQCNISNCQACNSSTFCTLCKSILPGYSVTSAGNCVTTCGYGCFSCNIGRSPQCLSCLPGFSLNTTYQCNCLNGTFPSTTNVSCLACHSKCKTCNGPLEFNCTSCPTTNTNAPYFNSTTSSCQSSCGLYFFENQTALQCQSCLFNCRDCATSPECTECDLQNHFRKLISRNGQKTCSCIVGYYQDPQNATNPVCKKCIDNCLTCRDNSTCDACNQANGYILSSNKTCIACGFGCVSCDEVTLSCTRCKPEFELDSATKQCMCPNGTVRAVGSVTCTSCHPTCKSCSGPTQYECTSCSSDQNRIGLKQANNLTQCICDPFAYTESTDGSLTCLKKTNESCDYGFIYIKEKKSCIEICGDGKNFGMYQCDDGNLVDGDGCSKTCQVEQDFDCKTVDGAETCYYVGVVNIVKAKAYKYPFSNHLLIQCKLDPIKKFFYTLDWKSGIVLVGPKMQVLDSWMEEEWLNINTTYFEDLTGKTLTIKYSSGLAKNKTIRSTGRTLFDSVFDFDITLRDYELPIAPTNNVKPTYLEDNTYQTVKAVQRSLFITAICTIAMILAAFALKTVFPFWQLIFALQTMFLSLGVINYMNPLLTGLTEFSVVKGLRSTKIYFESLVSPNSVIEYNIASLGYVSSFFGNMNIMMFIWFALILTSGALFLMSKKDLTMGFPFQFCKRSLMLLVLFSLMGYTFSVGLITSVYPFELTVAGVCGVIIIAQLYNLLKHMKRYYHFDRTFDLTNKKIKYIVAMIIFTRVAQALVISLFRTNTFVAACIILAAQVLLTGGVIVFRPYTKTLFNVLNIVGELAVTGFLAIDLIANLNFIASIDTENLLSLVQISLNFLIVLLMVGCFIYSVVIDYCIKEKNLNPLKFDDFEAQKSDSFDEYKNSSNVSKEKFNLKVQDLNDYDNSHVFINQKNSKYLIVSK